MTSTRVRAQQAQQPSAPLQMVRVTIATADPLTVTLPGGAVVAGCAVPGLTYLPDAPAFALIQEPAVGPVLPIT